MASIKLMLILFWTGKSINNYIIKSTLAYTSLSVLKYPFGSVIFLQLSAFCRFDGRKFFTDHMMKVGRDGIPGLANYCTWNS